MSLTIYNSDSYDVLSLPNGYRGLNNDVFHKFITFQGIPILAPDAVDDNALCEARYLFKKMFEKCDHRIEPIRESNLFITIIPEFPGGVFDPSLEKANIIVVNEQDILLGKSSVVIHEISHALHHTLTRYEKNKINEFFNASQRYYGNAYAATNVYEYFAEGATAYFSAGTPTESVRNRKTLRIFDKKLYNYIDGIFESNSFQYTPVNERLSNSHLKGYTPNGYKPPKRGFYHERREQSHSF